MPRKNQTSARVDHARSQFKALLLDNPNYFGNLKESSQAPVLKMQANTRFEEIGCVGYQPQLKRLEAVVFVKQPSGYGGDICTAGTQEFVRFYLSFDGGATWQDQGLTSFTAYDIPEGTRGRKRLEYAVSLSIDPPELLCEVENVILARAILSWNLAPPADTPNYNPVWGEVHNTHILVDPYQQDAPLGAFLAAAQTELPEQLSQVVDLSQKVTLKKPRKLSASELKELYHDKDVEPERFGLAEVQKHLDEPTGEAMALGEVAFADLDVDAAAIAASLSAGDGSTRYEELVCVGLNSEQDELVGVLKIKLPYGFSGDPCTAGSTEYVTFWGDFDGNGSFETCLGTAVVQVYDIGKVPEAGLEYAVALPVDVNDWLQPCKKGPKVVRLRATLSWETPPPCANPNWVPVWGNREETLIHIRPGRPFEKGDFTPYLYSVCNIGVCQIDQSTGWAPGDRPFGRGVRIAGEIPAAVAVAAPNTLKYRVSVRPLNDFTIPIGPWQALNNPFSVQLTQGFGLNPPIVYGQLQQVDGSNFYTYREHGSPVLGPWRRVTAPNRLLAVWATTEAQTGLWEIKVEALDLLNNLYVAGLQICVVDGTTRQNVNIRLDQTPPEADLAITGFSRNGGPVQPAIDCATFQVGDVIHGTYVATDAPENHFGVLTLTVEPSDAANGATVNPPVRTYPTVLGPGESSSWTLDTAGMDPCGFTVRLQVWDRTIVGCGNRFKDEDFVGFCLVAAPA